jgi:hypothetical protein
MANSRRRRRSRKSNRSHAKSRRRSMNPRARVGFRRHGRRRNPGVAGFSTNELMNLTLGAAVGGIGSKYAAQVALGSNNSGIMGYAAQGIATIAIAWAANKWVGKSAATGVVAGGGAALALRIFNDTMGAPAVVPAGPAAPMSGLGDPDMGRLGVGLGDFRSANINMPDNWKGMAPVAAISSNVRRRG